MQSTIRVVLAVASMSWVVSGWRVPTAGALPPTTNGGASLAAAATPLPGALECGSSVAFFGGYAVGFQSDEILTANGHAVSTVTGAGILGGALAGIDVLYMSRAANPTPPELAAIKAFIRAGGTLITEFSATPVAMSGLGFVTGALIDSFFVPSGNVSGGNLATVVAPANPLATALPGSWSTGDPIGAFQVLASIDPRLQVVAEVKGTVLGDVPIVATGCLDAGNVVFFFTDFADFQGAETAEEETLLVNAACFRHGCRGPTPAPALSAWGLAAAALFLVALGRWSIRRLTSASVSRRTA